MSIRTNQDTLTWLEINKWWKISNIEFAKAFVTFFGEIIGNISNKNDRRRICNSIKKFINYHKYI